MDHFAVARRIKGIEHAEIAASKADEVPGDQDQSRMAHHGPPAV
jgi:hypothetical protein